MLRCALGEGLPFARLDPEDVQTVLQAFYTACEAVIQRFDGYIAQYDSTGLLAYFGYRGGRSRGAAGRAAGLMLVDALGLSRCGWRRTRPCGWRCAWAFAQAWWWWAP